MISNNCGEIKQKVKTFLGDKINLSSERKTDLASNKRKKYEKTCLEKTINLHQKAIITKDNKNNNIEEIENEAIINAKYCAEDLKQ